MNIQLDEESVESMLDMDDFRKWLENQPPGKVVGNKGEYDRCPVAQYLVEKVRDAAVKIAVTYVGVIVNCESVEFVAPAPDWCDKFVHQVDEIPGGKYESISRESALEVLNRVSV